MKIKELKIEYLPKEELKTYAKNAKIHTAGQVEAIKNSIEKFGFNDPIAIWKNDEIIEGHGRLLAAMEMDDVKTVPVIRLDGLTDKERKAYIIAHNKLTLNTTFDNELLGEELKEILDEIDMTELGFGDFELSVLTEDFEPEEFNDVDFDEYKDVAEGSLKNRRVIITFEPEQEDLVKELLGVDGELKVVYKLEELSK